MLLILNKCITQQCLHINKQVGLKTVAGALPGAGEVRVQSSRTTCGKGASVRILFRGRAILFPRIHNTLFSCKWNQPLLIWHVCPPHAFYLFFFNVVSSPFSSSLPDCSTHLKCLAFFKTYWRTQFCPALPAMSAHSDPLFSNLLNRIIHTCYRTQRTCYLRESEKMAVNWCARNKINELLTQVFGTLFCTVFWITNLHLWMKLRVFQSGCYTMQLCLTS